MAITCSGSSPSSWPGCRRMSGWRNYPEFFRAVQVKLMSSAGGSRYSIPKARSRGIWRSPGLEWLSLYPVRNELTSLSEGFYAHAGDHRAGIHYRAARVSGYYRITRKCSGADGPRGIFVQGPVGGCEVGAAYRRY